MNAPDEWLPRMAFGSCRTKPGLQTDWYSFFRFFRSIDKRLARAQGLGMDSVGCVQNSDTHKPVFNLLKVNCDLFASNASTLC